MGLDIYAGTLTRYYCHDWKNITQQMSEEHGQKCVMLDGCGNEIKPVDNKNEIEQIRGAICRWIDSVAICMDQSLDSPLWDEERELDYYTDKPDWEAYGALIMLCACQLLKFPLPEYVYIGWNAFDEPVVEEAMSQDAPCSLLSNVTVWLPIPKKISFVTTLPNGGEATFSTVEMLKQDLDELNQKIWKADEATILSWRNDKYYNPVKQKKIGLLLGFIRRINKTPKEKYRTEELAQCAYSMLYQAVNFAYKHQVPIILDY
ncbi:MAG: hypothetical protein K2G77_07350 [Muribaculaceae bacterium]|nr:hypothetical protein [Muribaculaceae bacterium]